VGSTSDQQWSRGGVKGTDGRKRNQETVVQYQISEKGVGSWYGTVQEKKTNQQHHITQARRHEQTGIGMSKDEF